MHHNVGYKYISNNNRTISTSLEAPSEANALEMPTVTG